MSAVIGEIDKDKTLLIRAEGRCLIIPETFYDRVVQSLTKACQGIARGTPLDGNNPVGPLINHSGVEDFFHALKQMALFMQLRHRLVRRNDGIKGNI